MSSSVFRVLSAGAAIGRVFTGEEERRRDRVVVLAHELWQRRFGESDGTTHLRVDPVAFLERLAARR